MKVKGAEHVDSFGTDEDIHRIVSQYSPMLLRIACARVGVAADAEDAVQGTFCAC